MTTPTKAKEEKKLKPKKSTSAFGDDVSEISKIAKKKTKASATPDKFHREKSKTVNISASKIFPKEENKSSLLKRKTGAFGARMDVSASRISRASSQSNIKRKTSVTPVRKTESVVKKSTVRKSVISPLTRSTLHRKLDTSAISGIGKKKVKKGKKKGKKKKKKKVYADDTSFNPKIKRSTVKTI